MLLFWSLLDMMIIAILWGIMKADNEWEPGYQLYAVVEG